MFIQRRRGRPVVGAGGTPRHGSRGTGRRSGRAPIGRPLCRAPYRRGNWARGVQKGGICSIIEAIRAVDRAGFRLRGPVTGLFVCDEESGQPGSGLSLGIGPRWGISSRNGDRHPTSRSIPSRPPAPFRANGVSDCRHHPGGKVRLLRDPPTRGGRPQSRPRPAGGLVTTRGLVPGRLMILGQTLPVGHEGRVGRSPCPGSSGCRSSGSSCPATICDAAARHFEKSRRRPPVRGLGEVVFSAPRDHPVGGTPDEIPVDHPAVSELALAIEAWPTARGRPLLVGKRFSGRWAFPASISRPGDIATCHTP